MKSKKTDRGLNANFNPQLVFSRRSGREFSPNIGRRSHRDDLRSSEGFSGGNHHAESRPRVTLPEMINEVYEKIQ